ncbi:MAG TPA: hypothetical protein VK453_25565 [Micromonosporaceae bacterium]|nr:hypothetical protein [Micromonosporaceae bacterium]
MSGTPPAEGEAKVDGALTWVSLGLGFIGGWAAIATWIGAFVGGAVGMLPDWAPPLLFVVGTAIIVIDVLRDGIPNRPAVYFMILLPSIGLGVNGKLSDQLDKWGDNINRVTSEKAGEWLGEGSLTALALIAIALAVVVAQKAIKKTSLNPLAQRAGARGGR